MRTNKIFFCVADVMGNKKKGLELLRSSFVFLRPCLQASTFFTALKLASSL